MKLINRSIEVPICHFHVKVVIAMLAIVPSFVLFYLRYVSYVSFNCRPCISVRADIRLTSYDSLLSLHHTINFN